MLIVSTVKREGKDEVQESRGINVCYEGLQIFAEAIGVEVGRSREGRMLVEAGVD